MNAQMPDPTSHPVLATYDKYLDAQAAVDKLSDNMFPVQKVAIVGVDLKLVEQVLGRMSWGRAAAGGLLTGAWFGLLLGFFVSIFTQADSSGFSPTAIVLMGLVLGAGFGIIFGLVSHALTGGKRDFVSRSQIIANRYDVHVETDGLGDARKILGLGGQWPPPAPVTGVPATVPSGYQTPASASGQPPATPPGPAPQPPGPAPQPPGPAPTPPGPGPTPPRPA